MPVSPEARALPLIELIYSAAIRPSEWQCFLEALAEEIGGDPVVGLNLQIPLTEEPALVYRVGSDIRFGYVFAECAAKGEVPWRVEDAPRRTFTPASATEIDEDLVESRFYQEYMEPQDLAPEGPVGHLFGRWQGRPMAAMGIYRRNGGRRIDEADLRMLDLLCPHLGRAYEIHRNLRGHQLAGEASMEVLNRIPMGVVLLDGEARAVAANRAARRIAEQDDGFSLEDELPRVSEIRSATAFREAVERAVAGAREPTVSGAEAALTIERPSGLPGYAVLVTGLLDAPDAGWAGSAVAVMFISDPGDRQMGMRELLSSLYELTRAEAELAALISEGESLESAAAIRGVSVNTVRSQLKQVFAKTGARRQGELVRMVLSGVTGLAEAEKKPARR